MVTTSAPTSTASSSTAVTVGQNIATAINNAAKTYLQVMGSQTTGAIAAATVVRSGAGRLCVVSITTAGSANGSIYDAALVGATSPVIYTIPNTIGVVYVNLPVGFGIVVAPGSGQVVSVSWS